MGHTASKAENQKHIWKIAALLAIITLAEFALAFAWPDSAGRGVLNFLFIVMTLVKAFYIVAEFMHLKHEVKGLILSIVLPSVFILWLILALLLEGSAIIQAVKQYWFD
jgi:cytochrome c oxidase subunit IV